MPNLAPYNLIMQVAEIWVAPVGTVFPDIDDDTPDSPWALLGNAGRLDYDTDGVHIIMEQSIQGFMGSGSTMDRKVARVSEAVRATVKLADMSLETLSYALNGNSITTVAAGSGTPGTKAINLYQGPDVATFAACIRGYSPYSGDANSFGQFEIPNAYNADGWDIAQQKGVAWAYTLNLRGLIDPNNATSAGRAGRLITYSATPL